MVYGTFNDRKFSLHINLRMKPQIAAKLAEIRQKRAFNVEEWVQKKCELLNQYMTKSGLKGCVVNVSGGIDSALTIMLCKKASEQPGSPIKKVLGIVQPIHSTKGIMSRAEEFLTENKFEWVNIDQSAVYDLLSKTVEEGLKYPNAQFASGMLKSYMRTPVAYYAAQLLSSNGYPAIVIGTGNYDEDGYLYYFCKPGDGTSDVQLIHDLHKSEVFAVSRYLGVSEKILGAPPSADLWDGQTDEGELGFSYDFCELYVELLHDKPEMDKWVQTLDKEAREQWDHVSQKIETTHRRNSHKEVWPVNLDIICPTGKQYVPK